MLNELLAIVPNEDGNFYFDSFGEALVYALIGFLVVFVGIVLIICIIYLIGFIMKKTNNFEFLSKIGKKKKKPQGVAEPIMQCGEEDIPNEVKAAIIAAIMTYYSEKKPECEFRVKRIKRI